VEEPPVRVGEHHERQHARPRHVRRAERSNRGVGLVAVDRDGDEGLREGSLDRFLRDDSLDEGAASASGFAPVLDEDLLVRRLRGDEGVGERREPGDGAAVVEMRVSARRAHGEESNSLREPPKHHGRDAARACGSRLICSPPEAR